MRLALISDIHGNLPALEQILRDAKENGAERYVFLGDYIFDLPFSNQVVDVISALPNADCIAGNKEGYLRQLSEANPDDAQHQQVGVLYQTRRELTPHTLEFLTGLPKEKTLLLPYGYTLYMAHTLPNMRKMGKTPCNSSSAFKEAMYTAPFSHETYLKWLETYHQHHMAPELDAIGTHIVAYGHNHLQGFCKRKTQVIVNPGSCGAPLDCNPRAAYTLLTVCKDGINVMERRVEYDIKGTIELARKTACYQAGRVWSELVYFGMRTGVDPIGVFFDTARRIAARKGEQGDLIENDTMDEAYHEMCPWMQEVMNHSYCR